jgi:hypothetical protein
MSGPSLHNPNSQLSSEPVMVKRNHIDDFMQIPA